MTIMIDELKDELGLSNPSAYNEDEVASVRVGEVSNLLYE
jgi:hypothetical protein